MIRFASLRRKARETVAEVGTVERSVFVDLPREEASAKGTEWNKSDSEFLERRQDFCFGFSPPKRVFTLQRSDRLDRVCAADRLHSRFRKSEVLNFSFLNQSPYRSSDVFDRNVRIDAVLIEQIDRFRFPVA